MLTVKKEQQQFIATPLHSHLHYQCKQAKYLFFINHLSKKIFSYCQNIMLKKVPTLLTTEI